MVSEEGDIRMGTDWRLMLP